MSSKYCVKCGVRLNNQYQFCVNCGVKITQTQRVTLLNNSQRKGDKKISKILIFVILGILLILLLGLFSSESINDTVDINEIMDQYNGEDLEAGGEVSAAVVNIHCPFYDEDFSYYSDGTGGSGVVIDSEGFVITNSHVIPQNDYNLETHENGCIVIFPDTGSGLPKQAYVAEPIVFNDLSVKRDLALLQIIDVYKDSDGRAYGKFPNTFPFITEDTCDDELIKLGERIVVYGYPSVTGGYNLTVTDGVISAFNDKGIIISAKIDSGNSGGLVVDDKGCFIGIPTIVNYGDAETYGELISKNEVVSYLEEIASLSGIED